MAESAKPGSLFDTLPEISAMVFLAAFAFEVAVLTLKDEIGKGHLLLVVITVTALCAFQGIKYTIPQVGALFKGAKAVPPVPRG